MTTDFALDTQRNQEKSPADAIYEGCLIRLPAEARRPFGLVVVDGLVFSQLITLYIAPVIYIFLESFREKRKGWFRK